jgi:hypothetical protein
MQRSYYKLAVLAAVFACAAIVPNSAMAGKFTGSYSGKASVKVKGSSITINSVNGTGKSTLGSGKLTGKNGHGRANQAQGCGFFKGAATITGKKGSIHLYLSESKTKACGKGNSIAVRGSASVKGGSGKYKKAKGSLSFSGTFNKATGAFSVKFTGKV